MAFQESQPGRCPGSALTGCQDHAEAATFPPAAPPPGARYHVVDLDRLPGIPCPCGIARRGLADVAEFPGTIHRTDVDGQAKLHYHQRLTETYYVLDCAPDASLQLDEQILPVRPGMCVVIPPGVRHRGIGRLSLLIVVIPKFDPSDEVLVTES